MKRFQATLAALLLTAIAALALSGASAQAPADFKGPEYCGECHVGKYAEWNATKHAMAYSDPVFQAVWTARGSPAFCLNCHTTGFDPATGEYASEGVTCESCHGPGGGTDKVAGPHGGTGTPEAALLNAELCGECHTGSHHPTFEEWNASAHAASLEDIAAIGREKDPRCMPCRTAEGFLAKLKDKDMPEEARNTITCQACHDPHELELRVEPAAELCGECHTGTIHHPQYDVWKESSHALVNVGCENCHMYTRPYVSEEEPAVTGHTFEIVEDERGRPLICGSCHGVYEGILDYEGAVAELAKIQSWYEEESATVAALIEEAKSAFEEANNTLHSLVEAGKLSKSELADAFDALDKSAELLEEAETAYETVGADKSGGIHNPEFYAVKLTEAKLSAEYAKSLAEAAKELGEALASGKEIEAQVASLQAQLTELQADKAELETQVNELAAKVSGLETSQYIYLGGGLVVGLLVGFGFAVVRRGKRPR